MVDDKPLRSIAQIKEVLKDALDSKNEISTRQTLAARSQALQDSPNVPLYLLYILINQYGDQVSSIEDLEPEDQDRLRDASKHEEFQCFVCNFVKFREGSTLRGNAWGSSGSSDSIADEDDDYSDWSSDDDGEFQRIRSAFEDWLKISSATAIGALPLKNHEIGDVEQSIVQPDPFELHNLFPDEQEFYISRPGEIVVSHTWKVTVFTARSL